MTKFNRRAKLNALISTTLVSLVFVLFLLALLTRPNFQALAEGPNGETNTPVFSTQAVSTASATQTLTEIPTGTLTPTSTATPASTQSSTPTKESSIFSTTGSSTPFILLGLIIAIPLIFFVILNTRTQKVQLARNRPPNKENADEKPRPIYTPVKGSENKAAPNQNELNDELRSGFEILRELYDSVSKEQNDAFVSIGDLEILLKHKYPEKKIDLLKIAIEVANTQGGLLKIQQAREETYLIQVL